MIEIKAKLVSDRISLSRAGGRARRQPTIVLGTGAVIKLSPGRSVRVTEGVYQANKALLEQFSGMIEISGDLPTSSDEPVKEKTAPVDAPTEVVEASEPEILVVQEAKEEPPASEEQVEAKPKPKRRKRKTKAEREAEKRAKEEAEAAKDSGEADA